MALPPSIPTSFVPHSSGSARERFRPDFGSAFGFFAYLVLIAVFLSALGVFFYGRILIANKSAKDATLAKAEAAIDPATAEEFVRLRDRLSFGKTLFEKHVAFSSFFASLGTLLPANVRFSLLHISLDTSGVSKVEGSGIAKNFNALAAVSTAFAADGRIKDAIFSKISVNRDNSVSFQLSATIDPKLTAFAPDAFVPSEVIATTTPSL